MSSLTPDLIQFFIHRVPGVGRTQIVKFLYLADLEAHRYLGRPISDLRYIWGDYGPFDKAILQGLDWLQSQGKIQAELVCLPNGIRGWRYYPKNSPGPQAWGKEDQVILDYIVNAYGTTDLQTLLDDVVYQTEPMLEAKEKGGPRCQLRMEMVDNQGRIPGLELERVISAVKNLEAGKGKPYKEFFSELRGKWPTT